MKKYNKPAIEIIKIATCSMIAESVGLSQEKVNASVAEGRSSNSWDED